MTPLVFLLALLGAANVVPPVALRTATRLETGDTRQVDTSNTELNIEDKVKETLRTSEEFERANRTRVVRNTQWQMTEKYELARKELKRLNAVIVDLKNELESVRTENKLLQQKQCETSTLDVSQSTVMSTEPATLDTTTPASTETAEEYVTTPASSKPAEQSTDPIVRGDISGVTTITKQPQVTSQRIINNVDKTCSECYKTTKENDYEINKLNENIIALKQAKLMKELEDLERGSIQNFQKSQRTDLISLTEHQSQIRALKVQHATDINFCEDKLQSMDLERDSITKKLNTTSTHHEDCKKSVLKLTKDNQIGTANVKELEAKVEVIKQEKEAAKQHETTNRLLEEKLNGVTQKLYKMTEDLNLSEIENKKHDSDVAIEYLRNHFKDLEKAKAEVDKDLNYANANLVKERQKISRLENEVDKVKKGSLQCPLVRQRNDSISWTEHREKMSALEETLGTDIAVCNDQLASLNVSQDDATRKLKATAAQHKDCEERVLKMKATAVRDNQTATAKVKELGAKTEELKEEMDKATKEFERKYRVLETDANNITQKNIEMMKTMADLANLEASEIRKKNDAWLELRSLLRKCQLKMEDLCSKFPC